MSEWVESHASLPRHRKTRKLARLLEISVPHALGYMHMLWYYALDFAPGGDLSAHDPSAIADGCLWEGDAEQFVTAFVDSGWLDRRDGLFIHDWEDCNQSHRKRLADAERQRAKRLRDRQTDSLSRDVTVTVTTVTPDRQTDRTDRTGQTEGVTSSIEEEVLRELRAITEYPFDESVDLAMLREKRDPRVNLVSEVRKYRDYWRPKWKAWKKKAPPNHRLAWRNWLEQAEKYCREKNGPIPLAHSPFPEDNEPMTVEERRRSWEEFGNTPNGQRVKGLISGRLAP